MRFRVVRTFDKGFVLQSKKYFWNKWFTYDMGYCVEELAILHLEEEVARYKSEKKDIKVIKKVKV